MDKQDVYYLGFIGFNDAEGPAMGCAGPTTNCVHCLSLAWDSTISFVFFGLFLARCLYSKNKPVPGSTSLDGDSFMAIQAERKCI